MSLDFEGEKAAGFIEEMCSDKGIKFIKKTVDNSIYLYFSGFVLKISDQFEIELQSYRFNLIKGLDRIITIKRNDQIHSRYYPFREVYTCLNDIFSEWEKRTIDN